MTESASHHLDHDRQRDHRSPSSRRERSGLAIGEDIRDDRKSMNTRHSHKRSYETPTRNSRSRSPSLTKDSYTLLHPSSPSRSREHRSSTGSGTLPASTTHSSTLPSFTTHQEPLVTDRSRLTESNLLRAHHDFQHTNGGSSTTVSASSSSSSSNIVPPGSSSIKPSSSKRRSSGRKDGSSLPNGAIAELKSVSGITCATLLGSGTFGEVWSALTSDGVSVAAKILFDPYSDDSSHQRRLGLDQSLICEISAQIHLCHPNIVKIERVIELPLSGTLALIMPLGTGTLSDYLLELQKRSPLHSESSLQDQADDIAKKDRIAGQLISGICHIGQNSLLHLDLKPDNIIMITQKKQETKEALSDDDVIAISDFGLCQSVLGRHIGRKGSEVITRWWRSPDLQCGLVCGFTSAADFWSSGIILVQIWFDLIVFKDVPDDAGLVGAIAERIGWPEDFRALLRRRSSCPIIEEFEVSTDLKQQCELLDARTSPQKNDLDLARSLLGSNYEKWREYYGDHGFGVRWHVISELLQVVPWRRSIEAARSYFKSLGLLVDVHLKDEKKIDLLETKLVKFDNPRYGKLSNVTLLESERLWMRTAYMVNGQSQARERDHMDVLANLASKFLYDYILSEKWSPAKSRRLIPLESPILKIIGYDMWI